MNRLLPAAMVALVLCLPAIAGSTNLLWRWSNPLPFGANIADLATRPGEAIIAVAEYGQLFSTDDVVHWTRRETGTTRWLRSATYFGTTTNNAARQLVVSGESGTILVSEDIASYRRIDLGTSDWLEGVTASPTRLVAVGDNAAIYTSDNGTNWLRRANSFSGTWLRGVTWRTNGVFVTVGEGGLIATSANGINWTRQNSRTSQNLNRVIPISTGFCAVGEGGVVVLDSSGNGSNWRVVSSGAGGDLYAAAQEYRADLPGQPVGALLVAGDSELRSGIPAINVWIDETDSRRPAPAPKATYLAGFWNRTEAIFAGRAGLILFGTRPTAASSFQWSLPDSPPRSWLFAAATNSSYGTNITSTFTNNTVVVTSRRTTNTFIVAVGDGPTILQSDRGIDWSTSLLPTNAAGIVYLGVASGPRLFTAVGSSGVISYSRANYEPLVSTNNYTNSSGAAVKVVLTNLINTLGLVWSPATSPVTNNLQGIAASTERFVAAGSGGVLLTSTDAVAWTRLSSPSTNALSSVAYSPVGWVATGDRGTALRSTDGLAWNPVTTGTSQWIWRTRWLGNGFVAVGYNGTLLTSADGLTWTARNTGITNNLNDVILVDRTYYAVGNQGVVLGSPDAIQWTRLNTITTKSLQGLAYLDGRLIALGADGAILRAEVGPSRQLPSIARWPQDPGQSLFLFTGERGQFFRYDRGTNLIDWLSSDPLEITDPTGALLLIDKMANDPTRQFFRARQVVP
jgi:hypothetical protein